MLTYTHTAFVCECVCAYTPHTLLVCVCVGTQKCAHHYGMNMHVCIQMNENIQTHGRIQAAMHQYGHSRATLYQLL